jgi:hypothetical protein
MVLVGLAFAALFITGPGNIDRWTLLLCAASAAVMALHWGGRPRAWTGRIENNPLAIHIQANWRLMMAQTLGIAIAVAFIPALWGKAPAWKTAFETGVFGDASSAAWIGVADYIRDNTLKTSSVLPITYRTAAVYPAPPATDGGKARLWATRSLGTRAGRAMPVPEDFPGDFRNPDSWQLMDRQKAVLKRIEAALQEGDFQTASRNIEALVSVPDYIVLPTAIYRRAGRGIAPYVRETDIGAYTVLRRQE